MAVYGVSRATRDLLKLYAGGPQDAWDVEQLLSGGERSMLVTAVAAAPDAARGFAAGLGAHRRVGVE
jgi:NADH:ubiquinone oxidoreductase subunit F (NADH-binding)